MHLCTSQGKEKLEKLSYNNLYLFRVKIILSNIGITIRNDTAIGVVSNFDIFQTCLYIFSIVIIFTSKLHTEPLDNFGRAVSFQNYQ